MNKTKLLFLLVLTLSLAALGAAQSNNTLIWKLRGYSTKGYALELYGVGDASPSRPYAVPAISQEWNATFFNLSRRTYFVRVRNLTTGRVDQTYAFAFKPNYDRGYIEMVADTSYLSAQLDYRLWFP